MVEKKLENHRKQKEAFEAELAGLDKVFYRGTIFEDPEGGGRV